MSFFSGFSLKYEQELFYEFLKVGDFTVSGFSLGAIDAFEYVKNTDKRVDTLQLFSPSFFQDKDEKYKRLQTISYKKNRDSYEKEFLKNIAFPSSKNMDKYYKKDTLDSLVKLLNYEWKKEELQKLKDKKINIEVYLGEDDKIIDTKKAYNFFKEYATVFYIKQRGHILHG